MKIFENIVENFRKPECRWPMAILILFTFFFGYLIRGCGDVSNKARDRQAVGEEANAAEIEIWTCSMHPQIRQSRPGKCPICGMDLIPVSESNEKMPGYRELQLSERAAKIADIETAPVEHRYVSTIIRMVGEVAFDESRLKYITARVPGRIDRLYVDYTGIRVRKGDHLMELYSPQLISAQQELIEARKYATKTIESVKEKLLLLGLTAKQVGEIERGGKALNHLTIYSPLGGIVIQKNATEGQYVETGTRIYSIADLSRVWVKLDAYESDLPWIRYGQSVEFESETFPGERFTGKIAFIDPVLNPNTRTVKIRVNVDNPEMKMKPEMFVRAIVRSKLSASGRVMDVDLMGKWISPMHPEIVKDHPGNCDICGMPLVKAEELGYLGTEDIETDRPLVIPQSAPLVTGTRAVVYVAVAGKRGVFQNREIVLGPRAGDYYIVKQGLKEGERVVTNGNFKIDSDLQIKGRPSMMNPEGAVPLPAHDHGIQGQKKPVSDEGQKNLKNESREMSIRNSSDIPVSFKKSADLIVASYFEIQHALSSDSLENARREAEKMVNNLTTVHMELLGEKTHKQWMELSNGIVRSGRKLAQASDILTARVQFEVITGPITEVIQIFGSKEHPVYRFHCPMAFDNKGAFWLQNSPETRNPYFGSSMLLCKDSIERLIPEKKVDQP